ncbi:MAG: glucosaminidase domain-containing protein [Muribaculaceae bacterium]|nr:glucosaminidase domain-containing protein [Muribaculaceae bacterium]MDE7080104.1 glucosaminidase domain-containing protein [Muribaculaceae bacterium]
MPRCLILLILLISPVMMLGNAYEDYIARYSAMAVEQMRLYGVPASITLAQGLLESGAGRSTLAVEGNNHFGIKCHKEWTGSSMLRNDDAPDECFRVYDSPEESFRDHSLFLRRQRYASLFDLPLTDYVGWARGLKSCGYATDPNYADRLISIIELYSLQLFDGDNLREMEEAADYIHQNLISRHAIRRSRGLHYVIAQPGDTYGRIAKELKVSKKKLLLYNDAEADCEIKAWEEVYLQPKLGDAPEGVAAVTIGDGETMHSVAQRYGMRLESIKALNAGVADRPGSRLRLR